ncbi:MAG: hypothetical protein ABIF77_10300 [bacterium]
MKTDRLLNRHRRWLSEFGLMVLLLTIISFTTPGASPLLAGEEILIDGIVHVRNGTEPSDGEVTLTLEEKWRVGGEDDDIFFGAIGQVLADDEGNFYFLDTQLAEIKVYSPDGQYLTTLSREGDGPGETRRPGDMLFLPDGSLGIVQGFPGKIVKIGRDGTPAGSINLTGTDQAENRFGVLSVAMTGGGNIYLVGFNMNFNQQTGSMNQTLYLSRCDNEGKELNCYLSKEYPITYGDFVMQESGIDFIWFGRVAVDRDGKVYLAPERNEYAIQVLLPDGSVDRIIEREYKSYQRSDQDKADYKPTLVAIGRNYPVPPRDVELLDSAADILGMQITPDGKLWVSSSQDVMHLPDGIMAVVDEFDADGHYLHKVRVVGPADPRRDNMYFPTAGRVVVVTGALDAYQSMQGVSSGDADATDEPAPLEIVCFDIVQ